jgi:hypothetical protein
MRKQRSSKPENRPRTEFKFKSEIDHAIWCAVLGEPSPWRIDPEFEAKGTFEDRYKASDSQILLRVGGIVVFEDVSFSAISKVCRFITTNLSYSVVGAEGAAKPSLKRRLAESLLRHSPLSRFLRPEVRTPDESLALNAHCIAFQKQADDSRTWNHFNEF